MADDRVRTSIDFPHLPDSEYGWAGIDPASDGLPWLKGCEKCACRRDDPQELGVELQKTIIEGSPETLFYCVHRETAEGQVRVCASYAAMHPEQSMENSGY